jgi:hypothetical protein
MYRIIISIPPVLFEENAAKVRCIINDLYKKGFNEFEANSFTGLRILQDINAEKYLGPEMPVYNHLSAKYFFDLGYKSVYCPVEGDASIYKAVTGFSKGSIECLVFGRIPLFQSRVMSAEFIEGRIFRDKYCEVECFKQDGINLFVERKPFCLIGNKFKKENIHFDMLACDLRFFKDPGKVLDNIHGNNIQDTSDFNFSGKLT